MERVMLHHRVEVHIKVFIVNVSGITMLLPGRATCPAERDLQRQVQRSQKTRKWVAVSLALELLFHFKKVFHSLIPEQIVVKAFMLPIHIEERKILRQVVTKEETEMN